MSVVSIKAMGVEATASGINETSAVMIFVGLALMVVGLYLRKKPKSR